MLKVVGIDPGLAGTGVGVVEGSGLTIDAYAFGSIRTSSKDALPFRLNAIFSDLTAFLSEQKPDLVVIEDIFSLEKYPNSGILLGKVTGVILLASYRTGLEVKEISVLEAKKVVTGSGQADKFQVERSVRNILNHSAPIRPFHASDALALAMAGYFRYVGQP